MTILPDTDHVVQTIKRMHYQASKWYQSDLQTIHDVPFEGNEWIWCEDALVQTCYGLLVDSYQHLYVRNRENDYEGKQGTMKVLQTMNIEINDIEIINDIEFTWYKTEEAKRQ